MRVYVADAAGGLRASSRVLMGATIAHDLAVPLAGNFPAFIHGAPHRAMRWRTRLDERPLGVPASQLLLLLGESTRRAPHQPETSGECEADKNEPNHERV